MRSAALHPSCRLTCEVRAARSAPSAASCLIGQVWSNTTAIDRSAHMRSDHRTIHASIYTTPSGSHSRVSHMSPKILGRAHCALLAFLIELGGQAPCAWPSDAKLHVREGLQAILSQSPSLCASLRLEITKAPNSSAVPLIS